MPALTGMLARAPRALFVAAILVLAGGARPAHAQQIAVSVVVAPGTQMPPRLPTTGAPLVQLVAVAVLLIAVGAVVAWATARLERSAHRA